MSFSVNVYTPNYLSFKFEVSFQGASSLRDKAKVVFNSMVPMFGNGTYYIDAFNENASLQEFVSTRFNCYFKSQLFGNKIFVNCEIISGGGVVQPPYHIGLIVVNHNYYDIPAGCHLDISVVEKILFDETDRVPCLNAFPVNQIMFDIKPP